MVRHFSGNPNHLELAAPRRSAHQPAAVVSRSPGRVAASNANSDSGVVKREKPQFKQTTSFGNTKTQGVPRFLRLLGWTITSAANSTSLSNIHARQDISPPKSDGPHRDTTPGNSVPSIVRNRRSLDCSQLHSFQVSVIHRKL